MIRIFLFVCFCLPAFGKPLFFKSKTYSATGIFRESSKHLYLKINENTESEVRIRITSSKVPDWTDYKNTAVEVEFEIQKNCYFECEAILTKINRQLGPEEDLPFEDGLKPLPF